MKHPEPFRSRLIAAGTAKDSAEVAKVTAELRKAHPARFQPEYCRHCASGYMDKTDDSLINCSKNKVTKRRDEQCQCGDFSKRKDVQ